MRRRLCIAVFLVLAMLLSCLANMTALAAATLFSDDFDDGDCNGWSTSGTVAIDGDYKHSSPYSTRLKGDGTMWHAVSTEGYSNVTVEWYWAARSLESADHCFAEVNTGSGWTTVAQLDNGDDDGVFRYGSSSPSGADNNPNFQIRFRVTTAAADYCYVDNVVVSGDAGAPTATNTPLPTDTPTPGPTSTPGSGGGLDVAIYVTKGAESDKILALFRAINAMGHNVYGISRWDIQNDRLTTSSFDVLVVGAGEGGSKAGYAATDGLDAVSTKNAIKSFVSGGGGFVGLESGAYFASSNGGTLDLYGGDYNANSPTAGKYTFDIVDSAFGSGSQEAYMSAGGGYFSNTPGSATVVAEDSSDRPVIVRDTYGTSGRVILCTFDPELRGDSTLDWTIWDNWAMNNSHTNSENAWKLLGRMIDWAAGGSGAAPTISASNPTGGEVAVYATHDSDGGAWSGLIPAVARSVEYAGYTPLAIRDAEIKNDKLDTTNFDVITFPGGYAYGYKLQLSGYEQEILDFAYAGGGVMGTCAGSFYLADDITWDGKDYAYPVDLFLGWDKGPLDDIAGWPDYTLFSTATISDTVIGNLGDIDMMYYGGGYKTDLSASNATTVATYNYSGGTYDDTPNAIRFTYGSGHVLLIGTHPEARMGQADDWLYWDNYKQDSTETWNNSDNPWTFVDSAYDNWLIP